MTAIDIIAGVIPVPKKDGILSQKEKEQVAKWLNEKSGRLKCPSCLQRDFVIGDHLISPQIFYYNEIRIGGGPAYPQVMVTCTNCSYTMFFNAVLIGVLAEDSPDLEAGNDG